MVKICNPHKNICDSPSKKKKNKLTSLESGSRSFTVVNTDHTSFGIFNTRVSGAPVDMHKHSPYYSN